MKAQSAPSVREYLAFHRNISLSFELVAGLANSDFVEDIGLFREHQLTGLIKKIMARKQTRTNYTNLLATITFFCLYTSMLFLQKNNIEQSSMILVRAHRIFSDL
jgi:hypothetical protein